MRALAVVMVSGSSDSVISCNELQLQTDLQGELNFIAGVSGFTQALYSLISINMYHFQLPDCWPPISTLLSTLCLILKIVL